RRHDRGPARAARLPRGPDADRLADLAARGTPDRRRARQPRRPGARRRSDGFHRSAALADVQPGGRGNRGRRAPLALRRGALGIGASAGMRREAEALIVHLDDDLAVVEKPAGLVVHTAPSVKGATLVDLLKEVLGGGEEQRAGIVHRLDRDTSGLMVVARSEETHRELARMGRARESEREYTARVEGRLASRTGTIDAPLGRDRRQRTRRAVRGAGSRGARTHFEVIEALPTDTVLHARLETGRTHQIRVHFAAIGHPAAGDPEYGSRGRHGLKRQFLHASRLAFRHPRTGEQLEVTSELPEDLRDALASARKTG